MARMRFKNAIKDAFKNSWRLSAIVAGATWLLSLFLQLIGYERYPLTTGSIVNLEGQVAYEAGRKLILFLAGLLAIDSVMEVMALVVGSWLIVFSGRLVVNLGIPELRAKFLNLNKEPHAMVISSLFYGIIIASLFLGGMQIIPPPFLVTASIAYFLSIGIIIGALLYSRGVQRWLSR